MDCSSITYEHPIPVSDTWNKVGIDLIELPVSKSGNRYCITLTDYFSKWVEAAPIPTKEATHIAAFLYKMILRHGCPQEIVSDQGREFCNKLVDSLEELTGFKHKITSAYHPQSNGLDERFNQTLKSQLQKLVNDHQDDWDDLLDNILFAYRSSRQDSTKCSPFLLMYGREARLPIDLARVPSDVAPEKLDFETKVQKMLELQKELHDKARSNIEKAQARQKRQYDAKHNTNTKIKVGDKVLVQAMKNQGRKGGKLEPLFPGGPYIIEEDLGKGRFRLKDLSGKLLKTAINIHRLKVWNDPTGGKLKNSGASEKKTNAGNGNQQTSDGRQPKKGEISTHGSGKSQQKENDKSEEKVPLPKVNTSLHGDTVSDSEDDVPPLPPPTSPPSLPSPGGNGSSVQQVVPGGCQQQPTSRLRKGKVNEQNKGSRKRVKKEVKINLSPREVARLENGDILNDTHIDVANQMLRKQFPDVRGLQSPLLGQSLSFAVTEPPFVQVLHVDDLHWVTVIGVHTSLVKVYDSVFNTAGTSLALQTAVIMKTESDNVVLEVEKTQFQQGKVDCGLYAIAFATEFCYGNNPECYRYNQKKMRPHLLECIKNGNLTPFPSECVRRSRPVTKKNVEIHCDCRLPESVSEEMMAYCPKCRRWYHQSCQSIPDRIFEPDCRDDWFCSHCNVSM